MAAKKPGSHWYTQIKTHYEKGAFKESELEGGRLYAQGIYPSSMTPETLPEHFVEIWYRGKKYYDVKNVIDVVYKPSYWSDNHLFKDDALYISWREPLRLHKDQTFTFYENYDAVIWGWGIKEFVDAALRYAKGEMRDKFIDISRKLVNKMIWYTHIDVEHRELGKDEMPVVPEVVYLLRDMSRFYRPLSREEQIAAMDEFCVKYGDICVGTREIKSMEDVDMIAKELKPLSLDSAIRPIFLYCSTEKYNDPENVNEDPMKFAYRHIKRDVATLWSVFVRKDQTVKDA